VGGLAPETDEAALRDCFAAFGAVRLPVLFIIELTFYCISFSMLQ
jgi:hypothetical protein